MKCEQELCPFWSGSGCLCGATDLGPTDRQLARSASEGWASYAAEQDRHAESVASLRRVWRVVSDGEPKMGGGHHTMQHGSEVVSHDEAAVMFAVMNTRHKISLRMQTRLVAEWKDES